MTIVATRRITKNDLSNIILPLVYSNLRKIGIDDNIIIRLHHMQGSRCWYVPNSQFTNPDGPIMNLEHSIYSKLYDIDVPESDWYITVAGLIIREYGKVVLEYLRNVEHSTYLHILQIPGGRRFTRKNLSTIFAEAIGKFLDNFLVYVLDGVHDQFVILAVRLYVSSLFKKDVREVIL